MNRRRTSPVDEDYAEFKEFVKARILKYDQLSKRTLEQLKSIMEFEDIWM